MKPVLIPALDLWASWQREAALNVARAALMPMAAFSSMARSADAARGQSPDTNKAGEALLKAASESSERFAAAAQQAAESLREAVVDLGEASKELSRVAREAGEALRKDATIAADEIRQAGKRSKKAAASDSGGSRTKKSPSRDTNGQRRKPARSSERRAH